MNGWNNVVDNNTGKTYGVSFAWNPNKKLGITENYMAGPETNNLNNDWRQLSDTVITYSPTSKLSFIVNGDYGRGDRITDPLTAIVLTSSVLDGRCWLRALRLQRDIRHQYPL